MKERKTPLFVGEKVYDAMMNLVCIIVAIDGDKITVSQAITIEHNQRYFDLDCEEDGMSWETYNQYVYQFVPNKCDSRENMPICYEHEEMEDDYPYYSPYLDENLFSFETEDVDVPKKTIILTTDEVGVLENRLSNLLEEMENFGEEDSEDYQTIKSIINKL